MLFNTTFNNISVISRRSVLLVEETGVPGENHRPEYIINENQSQFLGLRCTITLEKMLESTKNMK
jgi:hypothetical protein